MPNDLSIGATNQAAPYIAAAKAAATAVTENSNSSTAVKFPSPVEHLDAALGIEVLQFVGQNGAVTQSFPSQRQLDAYQTSPSTANTAVNGPSAVI